VHCAQGCSRPRVSATQLLCWLRQLSAVRNRHFRSWVLLLWAISACSGARSPKGQTSKEPAQSADRELVPPEPDGPPAQSTSAPLHRPHCIVKTSSGACFESKEQACAALGCPDDCSYLYAGGNGVTGTVACN